MLLSSEPAVHPFMLTSIFKNPLGGALSPKANAMPPLPETRSQNPYPSNDGERSISVDTGLSKFTNLLNVPKAAFTSETPTEDYVQRTKKTAGYLRLLLHSRKCNGNCMKAACVKTSGVVEHMRSCFDHRCSYPGCTTSKKLIDHYEKCGINSISHSPIMRTPGAAGLCLLCSLVPSATTSPTHRIHYLSPEQSLYATPHLDEHDPDHENIVYNDHRRSLEAMEDHHSESPIIFDEVMQFSKVPFQDAPVEFFRHSMTSAPGMMDVVSGEEPPRKMRSKSMNAVGGMQELWHG